MNVQEASLRITDERSEQLLNRGPSFQERTATVAAAAAADAEDVDQKARFPRAALIPGPVRAAVGSAHRATGGMPGPPRSGWRAAPADRPAGRFSARGRGSNA